MSEIAKSVSLANSKKKKVTVKAKKVLQSIRLNWKATLGLSYSLESAKQINLDRIWADFINNIRKNCPETRWYSIFAGPGDQLDPQLLFKTQEWLKAMSASKNWPMPSEAIIKYDPKSSNSIQILVQHNTAPLPFIETPNGIIAARIRNKQTHGWEIRMEKTLHTFKAGHA